MPIYYGPATTQTFGYEVPADKLRGTQFYDAQADFGFVGDLVTVYDANANTSASSQINSAGAANFSTYASIGQRVTLRGAGSAGVVYVGTIQSIINNSSITVSPAISTSVASVCLQFGTDNTNAIIALQGLVNTTKAPNTGSAFPGVKVFFGQSLTNSYGFPITASFNGPIHIEGIGGAWNTDVGDYTRIGGTRLAWWGASQDGGVAFAPFLSVVATGSQTIIRPTLKHFWIDCRNGDQNQALIGLKMSSCHAAIVHDVFVMDAGAIAMYCGVTASPTEAADDTRWQMNEFNARVLEPTGGANTSPVTMTSAVTLTQSPQSLTVGANTYPAAGYVWMETSAGFPVLVNYTGGGGTTTLTGCTIALEDVVHTPATIAGGNVVQACAQTACAVMFDGGSAHNTCCATWIQGQLTHGSTWGPAAIEYKNSDSIDLIGVMINGGNNTNSGSINRICKPGVRINGSIVSNLLASRNNTFRGGSAGAGGLSHMGFNSSGIRLLAQAGPTYWDLYQVANGEPIPTVEGDTLCRYTINGGWVPGGISNASVADQGIPIAVLTSLTGSLVPVPPQGFQNGTVLRWTVCGTGSALGTAANTFTLKVGTAGTVNDTTIGTFTTPVGTAAASVFKAEVDLTVRTSGSAATGIAYCTIAGVVGFINVNAASIQGVMGSWNALTAQQFMSLNLTTGTTKSVLIQQCFVECVKGSSL